MPVYRAALIGTGTFAAEHMVALRAAENRVEVVAAVNTDVSRGQAFCNQHHIPAFFPTTSEMLAEIQPDLVHICTPPVTHADLAIACLQAGAHVLCEKPLCGSLAEFDRLQDAEARSGKTLSTVFQWRFGSAAQHLKGLVTAGVLGKLLLATCQTLWYRDINYYNVPWRGQWATSLGGTTMGHGIHLMDLLLWLLPDWQEVQAIMGTLDHAIEVEDVSLALVRFANGAVGSISNSALSPRQETHLRLDFQQATVEIHALYSYSNANWQYTPAPGFDDNPWHINDDKPGTLASEVRALLDSLDNAERPLVSGDESRRIIEFITCLYKSAMTGQPISRGSVTPDDPFYYSMRGLPR